LSLTVHQSLRAPLLARPLGRRLLGWFALGCHADPPPRRP
jgi:hypothetical protein